MTNDLLSIVRTQLQRLRTLPIQIESSMGFALNAEDSLPGQASGPILKLEEDEQELLLSRYFTPEHVDRAACEAALPVAGLSEEGVLALVETLVAETLSCPVELGVRLGFCPLPEVVIYRYVRLLGLNAPVAPEAAELISMAMPVAEQSLAMSFARRSVWRQPQRESLLVASLQAMAARASASAVKLDFLTSFVHTYRCSQPNDLCHSLSALIESYRIEQAHPTYNPRLETRQAEGIRSRYCDDSVKQFRITMAREILADFIKISA